MNERTHLAAASPHSVIHASGLLAAFNDAGVLGPLDVTAAQTVARLHGESNQTVMLAAALAVRGTRYGHVCVRLDSLREAVVVDGIDPDEVDSLPWPEPSEWERILAPSPLVGNGNGTSPLVLVEGRLYLDRYFRYEQQVADLLTARVELAGRDMSPRTEEVLDTLLAGEESAAQRRAAVQAAEGRLAVIAGGPGTGKTYTIGARLVALASDPDRFPLIALCAPTGKAAARLGEAINDRAAASGDPEVVNALEGVRPSTIHRLLGWARARGRFDRDATNRLPHDMVIVDEMSMVSLPMAAKLLEAVRDDATVVLVGDPFQLESIEAGTVLADIVGPAASGEPSTAPIGERVVVLERSHRFAREGTISDFADSVRSGDPDAALTSLEAGGDQLGWVQNRDAPGFGELWEEVITQRSNLVDLAGSGREGPALDALAHMAVLCARREGPSGVSRWSRDVEAALDERYPGLRWKSEWYPGRPVMITRNDYNLDLYNGDIGVVVETEAGKRAIFERGEVRSFPLSHLTEHTTVHAMTIHKSQGSQFDQVVVVLPDEQSRLLTRELLYTAVTRAKEKVWVMGEPEVIRQAVSRSVQRASGLSPRLWS